MTTSIQLEILYQDPYLIAVNKPAGLLVHRSSIAAQEKQFALQTVRNQIGRHVFPVHRLDRPTAGLLLFALSSETAKKTAELFQAGKIIKKYIAVVRGYTAECGTIQYSMKNIKKDGISCQNLMISTECYTESNYKRIATIEIDSKVDKYPTSRYSLVTLFPKTGRRHQLRRHMKHIRHPIIGDIKYGNSTHNHFFRDHLNCSCLLLNAVALKFQHPMTGSQIEISARVSMQFKSVLTQFNWYPHVEPVHI
jgi:tRNA pseudouridine65 synthase